MKSSSIQYLISSLLVTLPYGNALAPPVEAINPNFQFPRQAPPANITTLTLTTTNSQTITSCPPTITVPCQPSQMTTYVTATVNVLTTVCPVSVASSILSSVSSSSRSRHPHTSRLTPITWTPPPAPATPSPQLTTLTLTGTNLVTVTSCSITQCPQSMSTTYVSTQTTVYTTVCPISSVWTSSTRSRNHTRSWRPTWTPPAPWTPTWRPTWTPPAPAPWTSGNAAGGSATPPPPAPAPPAPSASGQAAGGSAAPPPAPVAPPPAGGSGQAAGGSAPPAPTGGSGNAAGGSAPPPAVSSKAAGGGAAPAAPSVSGKADSGKASPSPSSAPLMGAADQTSIGPGGPLAVLLALVMAFVL